MKNKKRKQRMGAPSDIAKLDFHDWFGNLIDRIKAKTSEKDKGVLMIDRVSNRFGLELDYVKKRLDELNREALMLPEPDDSLRDGHVQWTRDERGNIASPFRTKKPEE